MKKGSEIEEILRLGQEVGLEVLRRVKIALDPFFDSVLKKGRRNG